MCNPNFKDQCFQGGYTATTKTNYTKEQDVYPNILSFFFAKFTV
jgi:hypothetical protein